VAVKGGKMMLLKGGGKERENEYGLGRTNPFNRCKKRAIKSTFLPHWVCTLRPYCEFPQKIKIENIWD
jgi:hypothetical protein